MCVELDIDQITTSFARLFCCIVAQQQSTPHLALPHHRPRFTPEPHLLGSLVWNHIQWVQRCEVIALLKDIILANWSRLPGEGRREYVAGCHTFCRAVVVVLCCTQAGEHVAGVIRIRAPGVTVSDICIE